MDGIDGNGTCVPCPDDITCDKDGSTLEVMDLKPGSWRPGDKSDEFFQCPVKDACLGGNSTDGYCKTGHTGMLCAVCESGWYRRGSTSGCIPCPDSNESLLMTAGISAGIFVSVIVVVLLDLRFGWSRARGGSRLKLIVNCVQQLTVLTLFPVKWPDAVKDMGAVFEGISIDVSMVSPTCLGVPMDFYSRFSFTAAFVFAAILVPWIVAAVVASAGTCCALTMGRRARRGRGRVVVAATGGDGVGVGNGVGNGGGGGNGGNDGGAAGRERDRSIFRCRRVFCTKWHRVMPTAARYSLIVMLFAHPAVSGQTFFFFSCQAIGDERYLVADYSLRCYDSEWQRMLPLAIFMVVGFVVGIPLLLFIMLMRHRTAIKQIGREIDEAIDEAVVLNELGGAIDIDKARTLYRQIDTDNSGSIDFAEFAKFQLSHNSGDAVTSGGLEDILDMMMASYENDDKAAGEELGRKAKALMGMTRDRHSIQKKLMGGPSLQMKMSMSKRFAKDAGDAKGEGGGGCGGGGDGERKGRIRVTGPHSRGGQKGDGESKGDDESSETKAATADKEATNEEATDNAIRRAILAHRKGDGMEATTSRHQVSSTRPARRASMTSVRHLQSHVGIDDLLGSANLPGSADLPTRANRSKFSVDRTESGIATRVRQIRAHPSQFSLTAHPEGPSTEGGNVQGADDSLADERAVAEGDGVEVMLGVLWRNYKPEYV
jgi:hypothetical protein